MPLLDILVGDVSIKVALLRRRSVKPGGPSAPKRMTSLSLQRQKAIQVVNWLHLRGHSSPHMYTELSCLRDFQNHQDAMPLVPQLSSSLGNEGEIKLQEFSEL